jgi:hypothetical protein
MLGVDPVGSRRIEPAQVGCLVGPDGSCQIQKDRLDDHRDDQSAFDLGSNGTGCGGSLEACEKAKPLTGTWLEETRPRRFLILRRFGP